MFEPMTTIQRLKDKIAALADVLFCHRAIYAGLSLCHGSACIVTEKPELYGPMAALYAILALRG